MMRITERLAEQLTVKCAVGIIILLFVFPLFESLPTDYSQQDALAALDSLVLSVPTARGGAAPNLPKPLLLRQVRSWYSAREWMDGNGRALIYLDLGGWVFCDSLRAEQGDPDAVTCNDRLYGTDEEALRGGPDGALWGGRNKGVTRLKETLESSSLRWYDYEMYTYPKLDTVDSWDSASSRAVLDSRDWVDRETLSSITVTVCVILLISLGGVFMGRDARAIRKSVFVPLRRLAEEMEGISELELACFSKTEEGEPEASLMLGTGAKDVAARGVPTEIETMRKSFNNMRRAILSWGKYVPWPVVRQLLAAGMT